MAQPLCQTRFCVQAVSATIFSAFNQTRCVAWVMGLHCRYVRCKRSSGSELRRVSKRRGEECIVHFQTGEGNATAALVQFRTTVYVVNVPLERIGSYLFHGLHFHNSKLVL